MVSCFCKAPWKALCLPGSSMGQHFIDLLSSELNHFALGHYPAEHCLVFGSVILQQDRMIKKGTCDICHLLEKHLQLWWEDKFHLLLQETIRCDHSVRSTHCRSQNFEDCVVRLFSKLMLEGRSHCCLFGN